MAVLFSTRQRLAISLRCSLLAQRRISSSSSSSSLSSLLVINAGSSTLKYKLFAMDARTGVGAPLFSGLVELSNASSPDGRLVHHNLSTTGDDKKQEVRIPLPTHRVALEQAVRRFFGDHVHGIEAIGHRIVHGGENFHDASLLTPQVLAAIADNSALAPLHNPANLLGIDVATEVFGGRGKGASPIPQVGVFDTAFHATMPPKAFTYALPYDLYKEHGVRRYGFHGTSHQFVASKAAAHLKKSLSDSNLITCHLGNGSSMAALRHGQCMDTSMGLTPLEGLVMGTRSGDVDPALHNFLSSQLDMTIAQIDKLLNKQSGLYGLCGDSDIRKIQDRIRANDDAQADLALDVYCHRVRKYLGAYLLELGGDVDAIVFTAGIGENSAMVRGRVCRGLTKLGIEVDEEKNARAMLGRGPVEIQSEQSRIKVMVIPTDEELSIAEQTFKIAFQP